MRVARASVQTISRTTPAITEGRRNAKASVLPCIPALSSVFPARLLTITASVRARARAGSLLSVTCARGSSHHFGRLLIFDELLALRSQGHVLARFFHQPRD